MTDNNDPDQLAIDLRQSLIDSGVEPHTLEPLPGQTERSEVTLNKILHSPPGTPRKGLNPLLRAAVVVLAAVSITIAVVVLRPGSKLETAAAVTPPMLRFQDAQDGNLPLAGKDARESLQQLARKARQLPAPSNAPVQRVLLDAWWASTEQPEEGEARSAIIPVRRESFFLPDGTVRSIERRGTPLDKDGNIAADGSWHDTPSISDDSFKSPDPGPDYADELAENLESLAENLKKSHDPSACADNAGGCFMNDVVDLFHNYVLPPSLVSELWMVLADEASIAYLGRTHDRLGQPAEAFVARGIDGASQSLIFIDPATGAYLGNEIVLTEKSETFNFSPPAVISFTALLRSERISLDGLPDKP